MPRGIYIRTKPRHPGPNKGNGRGIQFLRQHANDDDGPCLIWPMSRDDKGYGHLGYNGRLWKASRLMCWLVYGPAPSPLHEAAHSCGNGPGGCVHPKHLSWKTGSENQRDSIRHGTFWRRGPGRPRFKLTPEQVAEINRLRGKKTQREIGAMFGVSGETIGKIFRGDTWKTGKKEFGGFTKAPYRRPQVAKATNPFG